jgi:hypothetical protein
VSSARTLDSHRFKNIRPAADSYLPRLREKVKATRAPEPQFQDDHPARTRSAAAASFFFEIGNRLSGSFRGRPEDVSEPAWLKRIDLAFRVSRVTANPRVRSNSGQVSKTREDSPTACETRRSCRKSVSVRQFTELRRGSWPPAIKSRTEHQSVGRPHRSLTELLTMVRQRPADSIRRLQRHRRRPQSPRSKEHGQQPQRPPSSRMANNPADPARRFPRNRRLPESPRPGLEGRIVYPQELRPPICTSSNRWAR